MQQENNCAQFVCQKIQQFWLMQGVQHHSLFWQNLDKRLCQGLYDKGDIKAGKVHTHGLIALSWTLQLTDLDTTKAETGVRSKLQKQETAFL